MRKCIGPSVAVLASLLLDVFALPLAAAQTVEHLILRTPTVSKTEIVFEYANDLWIVGREGGEARRLTTGAGREGAPTFRRTARKSPSPGKRGCIPRA
nr:hypothetical protein [Acidobacteriota bacterium]